MRKMRERERIHCQLSEIINQVQNDYSYSIYTDIYVSFIVTIIIIMTIVINIPIVIQTKWNI